jgi:predicted DNA-binding protein (UPF0251 family)
MRSRTDPIRRSRLLTSTRWWLNTVPCCWRWRTPSPGTGRKRKTSISPLSRLRLRHADQLRDPAAAKAWLVRIETREAFRLARRLRRFVALEPHVEELRDDGDLGVSLDVRRAIGALPPRTRAALLLHHYSGFSVEETADALGVSSNTVKTQLRKGLARVREESR